MEKEALRGAVRDDDPRDVAKRLERIERTLATALVWIAGSAATPLRRDEVEQLLSMLEGKA